MATDSLHDAIERDRAIAIPAPELVREFRRYAEGDQAAVLTPEQRTAAGNLCLHPMVDNVCDLVLATAAARLEFTGYRVEDDAVAAYLDGLVTKDHLTDLQFDVHYRALRDGNHYLGLSWVPERQVRAIANPADVPIDLPSGAVVVPSTLALTDAQRAPGGRVAVHHEPAWDGTTGMFVGYDQGAVPAYAVKDFVQLIGDPPKETKRRIVYFADHFERFVADGQGWIPFSLPGEDPAQRGQVPWVKRDGRPLGIPVVHFANPRFGFAPYGRSELANILGLQNALNASLYDYANAAQLTAFPMLKVRGIDPRSGTVQVGPGRVVGSSSPDSDVAMMEPGDLAPLKEVHESFLAIIARNTATPLHLIAAAAWPSGEAIRRADGPAITKAYMLAKTVGPAWATLGHRATEMGNAFGGLALDEDVLVTAVFADPGQLDPYSEALVEKARAETYATLATITDPILLAKTGLVDEAEAAAIAAGQQAAIAALPPVAEF
jgi:hypothetical protein